MNVEYEIQKLRADLNNLQTAFLQSQRNASATVGKVDDTSNKVVAITPYTDTVTSYIGDDDAHFFNVPQGMLSVSVVDSDGNFHNYYTVERENDIVRVYFDEPLESVATVTIMVQ